MRAKRPALIWKRMRGIPGLGRDVTVVAMLIAIGVTIASFLLDNVQFNWPWGNDLIIHAEFASVPGIAPGEGQEVRIAGVEVGDIRSVDVTDRGTAELTLAIKPGNVVFDNAHAVLRPKSPLNEMYVTIAPGGPPGRPLATGGAIPLEQTEEPVPIDQVLSHLDSHARAALTALLSESDAALANAPANLPKGLHALDSTLVQVRPVAQSLQTRTDRIRTLSTALSDIARAVGGNDLRLASISNSLQTTLAVVARNDDALSRSLNELPGVSASLRSATSNVRDLSAQLDPTLDDLKAASDGLPDALHGLDSTVHHLDSTVDALGPLVAEAKPVVKDLRPLVSHTNQALNDLSPMVSCLAPLTSGILPYLPDIKAFAAVTASAMSLRDADGAILRARLTVPPEMIEPLPKSLRRPTTSPTPLPHQIGSGLPKECPSR